MSELGDTFKAFKDENKQKRHDNLASSISLLVQRGYLVEQLGPHHFKIKHFQFWPTTGKYWNMKTKRFGRGVLNLIVALEKP